MHLPSSLRCSTEARVLGLAFPILAINPAYAPGVSVGSGDTSVTIDTGDLAMAAVAVAALLAFRRLGPAPLRGARSLLVPAGLLVLLVLAGTALGPALSDGYPLASKTVSAAKLGEYALLAVAVPLIVRSADDVLMVASLVVATSLAASTWGLLQIIGLVSNFDKVPAGRRMPSFCGYHDFAILSGLAVAIAVGAIALGHPRRLRPAVWLAAVSGVIGVVIAGAMAAVLALLTGLAFALVVMTVRRGATVRRACAVVAIAVCALGGSAVLRSGDAADFIGFLGARATAGSDGGVESYSQRTVLSYVGLRIFLDKPLTGVGWQGSELAANAAPYLPDVRRRFPDVTEEALPTADHPWGVQNAYVQAAADFGIWGLAVIVWLVLTLLLRPARTAFRHVAAAPVALATTIAALVCAVEWAALGLVAGGPAAAFVWFTIGAAAAVGNARPVSPADAP